MTHDPFSQESYRCRLEWGRRGARLAADRGDILVVVDILRFSTAVATAIHHGGIVIPCEWDADAAALAGRAGGEPAVSRQDVPSKGRFSLSPLTFQAIEPGTRVVLPSPNGATCCRYGEIVPHLFVGALVNAGAVATAVARLLDASTLSVTVLACGERWGTSSEDGELRMAVEDYLGAGAILAALPHSRSPEAEVCALAFLGSRDRLPDLISECGSGRELRMKGCAADVAHAAGLDRYDTVPVLCEGRLERLRG